MDRCQVNQDTAGLERTTRPETSVVQIRIILRGTRVCIVLCNQVVIVCGLFIYNTASELCDFPSIQH